MPRLIQGRIRQFNSCSNCFLNLLILGTLCQFQTYTCGRFTGVAYRLIVILSWPFMCSCGKHWKLHDRGEFACCRRAQALRDLQPKMKCWGMRLCNLLNRISRPVPTFSAHSSKLTATSELTAMIFNAYAACCSDKKNVTFYLTANFSSQESLNSATVKCFCVLQDVFFFALVPYRAAQPFNRRPDQRHYSEFRLLWLSLQ